MMQSTDNEIHQLLQYTATNGFAASRARVGEADARDGRDDARGDRHDERGTESCARRAHLELAPSGAHDDRPGGATFYRGSLLLR